MKLTEIPVFVFMLYELLKIVFLYLNSDSIVSDFTGSTTQQRRKKQDRLESFAILIG